MKKTKFQTLFFAFNWIVYGAALILTTAYCYTHMAFRRTYDVNRHLESSKIEEASIIEKASKKETSPLNQEK